MIIVEDGTNVVGGNSYCSGDELQQDATTYLGVDFMKTVTPDKLEQAIVYGHLALKQYIRGKVPAKDPLEYPLVGTVGVPPAIKRMALLCSVLALLDDDATDNVGVGKLAIPGAWTFEPSTSNKENKRADILKGQVAALLEDLYPSGAATIRFGRVYRC